MSTTITSAVLVDVVKPCLTIFMGCACVCKAASLVIGPCAYICNNLYAKAIHGKRRMLVGGVCVFIE